jgi:hypothetical protein
MIWFIVFNATFSNISAISWWNKGFKIVVESAQDYIVPTGYSKGLLSREEEPRDSVS